MSNLALQWTDGSALPIVINSDISPLNRVYVQTYQFGGSSAQTLVPGLINRTTEWTSVEDGDIHNYLLPATASPGVHELVIWAKSIRPTRLSTPPQQIRINYNPPNTVLTAGEADYFIFSAENNDQINLSLTTSNSEIVMYIWEPGSALSAYMTTTNFNAVAPVSGDYVVKIINTGAGDETYTLLTQRNGVNNARRMMTTNNIIVNAERPTFAPVAPVAPDAATICIESCSPTAVELSQNNTVSVINLWVWIVCLISLTMIFFTTTKKRAG